jgi:hypothetical protein
MTNLNPRNILLVNACLINGLFAHSAPITTLEKEFQRVIQIGRCHDVFRPHEQQVHTVVNRLSTVKHSSFSDMYPVIYVTKENVAGLEAIPLFVTFV